MELLIPPMDRWENEGGSVISSADDEARVVLDSAVVDARPVAASPGSYLFETLARVLTGAELCCGELEAAITDPGQLTGHESDAWEQLVHWAAEADVRAGDKNYTDFHLDWLRDLHSKLAQ